MHSKDHFAKAERIENTMNRLDVDADYETVIENCMLAGTHYLNGALHELGLMDVAEDLLHSDKPDITFEVPAWLQPAFTSMKYIEDLRPPLVRGVEEYDSSYGAKCLEAYRTVKELCASPATRP